MPESRVPSSRPDDMAGDAPADFSILRVELRSQRELLEARLDFVERLNGERAQALDKALDLQAAEYARRLDELNHQRAREIERDNEYLRGEVFERETGELRRMIEGSILARTQAIDELRKTMEASALARVQLVGDISSLSSRHAALNASITWLTRLVVGALVTGLIGFGIAILIKR